MLATREGRGADAADGARMNPWPFVTAAYALTLGRDGGAGAAQLSGDAARRGAADESTPMKAKHQRLTLALLALAAVVGAGAARAVGAEGPGGVLLRAVRRRQGDGAAAGHARCGWAAWSRRIGRKRAPTA